MKRYIIVVFLCSTIFMGCASNVYKHYEGPNLPNWQIAKVVSDHRIKKIISIDGHKVKIGNVKIHQYGFPNPVPLMLLPGDHTVSVDLIPLNESSSTNKMVRSIEFNVEADHLYELERWGNNLVLIDLRKNTVIAPTPNANDVIVRTRLINNRVEGLMLESLDNESCNASHLLFAVRLTPGQHIFELSYRDRTTTLGSGITTIISSKYNQTVSGVLEAGSTYEIHHQANRNSWRPILVKIEDK